MGESKIILTKTEAKSLGLKTYFTGKLCKNDHLVERWVSNETCINCNLAYFKKFREKHIEDELLRNRKYTKENPLYFEEYRKKNSEIIKKKIKIYAQLNKGKINAKTNKYRISKLQSIPKWVNLEKIKEIYTNCPKGFHVDHIIPLQGKLVSGMHVETNLQYLPKEKNISKGNKFIPYIEKNGNMEYIK